LAWAARIKVFPVLYALVKVVKISEGNFNVAQSSKNANQITKL
jgi:hypothetical protein